MNDEKIKRYRIIGICVGVIVVMVIGWFMWFYEPGTDYSNVKAGLQRTERSIDDIERHVDSGKETIGRIEQSVDDSQRTTESIEQSNNAAENAVSNAESRNRNAKNAVDRSIGLIEYCEEILERYAE